jgi:hypothetical protein
VKDGKTSVMMGGTQDCGIVVSFTWESKAKGENLNLQQTWNRLTIS